MQGDFFSDLQFLVEDWFFVKIMVNFDEEPAILQVHRKAMSIEQIEQFQPNLQSRRNVGQHVAGQSHRQSDNIGGNS